MPAIRSGSTPISGSRRCPITCFTPEEREMDGAVNMVQPDGRDVDPKVWTHEHTALIRTAAKDPAVDAHFRQCRDQEGTVPRGRVGSRLAEQSAAVVGPRLAFSRPHLLSGRQRRMQAATAAGSRRRLRPRTRFLVQGIDAASGAAVRSGEAETGDDARRPAAGVQAGGRGRLKALRVPNSVCCAVAAV